MEPSVFATVEKQKPVAESPGDDNFSIVKPEILKKVEMDSPLKSVGSSTAYRYHGGHYAACKYIETRLNRTERSIQEMVIVREHLKYHLNEYKKYQSMHKKNLQVLVDELNHESDHEPDWDRIYSEEELRAYAD